MNALDDLQLAFRGLSDEEDDDKTGEIQEDTLDGDDDEKDDDEDLGNEM